MLRHFLVKAFRPMKLGIGLTSPVCQVTHPSTAQSIIIIFADSGFEDIVYQSGVFTSGSLQSIISGSHYNRAWEVHSVFSEALERLLLKPFLGEKKPYISAALTRYCCTSDLKLLDKEFFKDNPTVIQQYEVFRKEVENGSLGKTAQFWMIYLNLMRMQMLALTSIQENDLDMLICAWKSFLPLYFAMNKVNYAR